MSNDFNTFPLQYKFFHAIMNKVDVLQELKAYFSDLAVDAHSIYTHKPCSALWICRESGTHLYFKEPRGLKHFEASLHSFADSKSCRYFIWDIDSIPFVGNEERTKEYAVYEVDKHLIEVTKEEAIAWIQGR